MHLAPLSEERKKGAILVCQKKEHAADGTGKYECGYRTLFHDLLLGLWQGSPIMPDGRIGDDRVNCSD